MKSYSHSNIRLFVSPLVGFNVFRNITTFYLSRKYLLIYCVLGMLWIVVCSGLWYALDFGMRWTVALWYLFWQPRRLLRLVMKRWWRHCRENVVSRRVRLKKRPSHLVNVRVLHVAVDDLPYDLARLSKVKHIPPYTQNNLWLIINIFSICVGYKFYIIVYYVQNTGTTSHGYQSLRCSNICQKQS